MTMLTRKALEELGLGVKIADRCRNFFAMGLVYWLFGRDPDATLRFIRDKFGNKPDIAQANEKAMWAGWNYGETTETFASSYRVDAAKLPAGTYRNIMGNQALAWGLLAAAEMSGKELFLGTYPITPASDILHELTKFKNFGVRTFQAEDEIAAICAAIGASFRGRHGGDDHQRPGIALKGEGMGLAVMLELPLIIVNVQRGGPSTGLPTKTEQADLFQAIFGRNGECPVAGHRGRQPGRLFRCRSRGLADRRAVHDTGDPLVRRLYRQRFGALADSRVEDLPRVEIHHRRAARRGRGFLPYERDERLARPWALPGTPGLMHRIGGLEKQNRTGNVSYDPDNHEFMVRLARPESRQRGRRHPSAEGRRTAQRRSAGR